MVGKSMRALAVLAACSTMFAAACSSGSGDSAGRAKYSLKFASYNVATSEGERANKEWADRIHKATNGRVEIKFFYQEALLPAAETLSGVADGRADMGYVATAYNPAELPLSNVVGVPYVTSDTEAQLKTYRDLYADYAPFRQEWEKQGVHVLAWGGSSENILVSKKPVTSVNDLRGKQLRGYSYMSHALTLAGANVLSIASGEVYEALGRGVLDATSGATLSVAVDRKFQEVGKHFVDFRSGNYAITGNAIRKDLWESMPQDIRDAITEVSNEYPEIFAKHMEEAASIACKEILKAGAQITILPESDVSGLSESARAAGVKDWKQDVLAANSAVDADEFFSLYTKKLAEHESGQVREPMLARCAGGKL